MADVKLLFQALWSLRQLLLFIFVPIVLCPLIIIGTSESYCAYVILLICIFWMCEVLPLPITALLPILLFPILGVGTSDSVVRGYLIDGLLFTFGAFFLSVAIEKWNLHKRVALLSLSFFGSKPASILLCLMLLSFFLSMWIENTAVAALIIPIARVLAIEMKKEIKEEKEHIGTVNTSFQMTTSTQTDDTEDIILSDEIVEEDESVVYETIIRDDQQKGCDPIITSLELGVAYSSLMGGAATLIGTGQTLYMRIYIESVYGTGIMSFGKWMLVAVPAQLLCIVMAWMWLQWKYLDFSFKKFIRCLKCGDSGDTHSNTKGDYLATFIREELKGLGPLSWAEGSVLCLFASAVVLWFTCDPGVFPGWKGLDERGYISLTQGSIAIALAMFILPANPKGVYKKFSEDISKKLEWERLMDTETMQTKYPWMVMFLTFGGGLTMGTASLESGLSAWLAAKLSIFHGLDPWVVVVLLTLFVALLCEGLGNVMIVIVVLPIISQLAYEMEVNPLYFIMPSILSATYAFMFPISSGPSIVAYSYGDLRIIDMVKTGIFMNIICLLINNLCVHTLCVWVFDIYEYPDWAPRKVAMTTLTPFSNTTFTVPL